MAHKGIEKCRSVYAVFLLVFLQCSYAATTDTVTIGQQVTLSNTILSAGGEFELGFFLPNSNSTNSYVGIWYKAVSSLKVIWVANRDFPFTSTSAILTISSDGNLVIMDGKVLYMITNISANRNNTATLLASGNLVLRDANSNVLWQSFDFPTDSFMPGMKFGYDRSTGKNWSLASWKSPYDPSSGDFSLMLDPNGTTQIFIMKGTQIYWTSGAWNGESFSLVPEMKSNYYFNFSYVSQGNASYFTYSLYNTSIISRLLMDTDGQIKQISWLESSGQWNLFWSQPRIRCEVYGYCGPFATCNRDAAAAPFCACLTGFVPLDPQNWAMDIYYEGCTRKANLQCNHSSLANSLNARFASTQNALAANPLITVGVSFQGCQSTCLSNCNCTAFAYSSNNCSTWEGDLLNLQQLSNNNTSGSDLYIRLAASEFNATNSSSNPQTRETGGNNINSKNVWIITTTVGSVVTLALYALICWIRKKKGSGEGEGGEDLLSFDFSVIPGSSNYDPTVITSTIKDKKEVEIPLFTFSSVSAATNDFSSTNKLGEGGFGPVYKGKLLNGHEVAVKRLSRRSGQGWEELKNEAMLIAKLQHKNLVKLLGCCIEGDEKILIYEYLQNKSLDLFLFGQAKHGIGILDWSTRVRIIEGIAQGLLYLHQFSRLQIIHRDLKASNILLDKDMNPKISDFGMARIFGGNESQATNRIVGTYGYMSPEYALEGIFSVKSDVFSFGVLLLEILSGKKNTGFYHSDSLNLLGLTWDLWKSDRSLELMDPRLDNISSSTNAGLRYINIALLCVQEHASDRPTMSDVISMLSTESASLPFPKQPAFSNVRSTLDPTQVKENDDVLYSVNELSVTSMEAR